MIYIDRTIIVNAQDSKTATIDKPVVLYKGDKNIELYLTFENNPYKQKATVDLNTTFAQIIIHRRNADPIFSPVTNLNRARALFIITGDMIDELKEVGDYDFQVRLINMDKTSRVTLPPIVGGILVREPICEEDTPGNINQAQVNESRLRPRQFNEVLEILDAEGNYSPVEWKDKDIITDIRMNHLEQGLYEISANRAAKEHNHDDLYYTEAEVDALIEAKLSEGHNHDDLYYTKAEVDQLIADTNTNTDNKIADVNTRIDDTKDAITAETEQKIADAKAELEQQIEETLGEISDILDEIIGG